MGDGTKKVIVFSILDPWLQGEKQGHYEYLSTLTGGVCLYLNYSSTTGTLKSPSPADISKVTVEILLAWMGVQKAGMADAAGHAGLPANISKYTEADGMMDLVDEHDAARGRFFTTPFYLNGRRPSVTATSDNITRIEMTREVLKTHLPKKATPVTDFAATWKSDPAYRLKVITHLTKIIEEDVRAIALNPVFGSLWRAVCADRKTIDDILLGRFASQADQIKDPIDKEQMRAWLEESYNFPAMVQEAIDSVPEANRFPCVCLDLTLNFVQAHPTVDEGDGDGGNKPVTAFTRLELQEIGRSCDFKVLRRLGRILTQLSYFGSRHQSSSENSHGSSFEGA